ncbi:MAG: hypothetical protein QNJ54_36715 [Prochloraceae cyanobacterium]|nr:hypothetical protein [Prochloraceae cyanobacterium]
MLTAIKSSYYLKSENFDIDLAIEAIATVISLKDIAISRELKKRSRANQTTIAKWQKEIKSLERTLEVLKSFNQ